MLTNVIAYLHTTLAYQSAVVQLMIGQANFDAQQLHLKESLPILAPANNNEWTVAMPPDGVTGGFATSNYLYRFNAGRLISIEKTPQSRAISSADEAAPSLLDTNGAYQLARQELAALSVDVAALESRYPHQAIQYASRPPTTTHRERNHTADRFRAHDHDRANTADEAVNSVTNITKFPLFQVSWGGGHGPQSLKRTSTQVSLEILGSTRQCTGLHIYNPELLKAPPLQVTNAAALLGPPPPPQYFVGEFLGGNAAYNTVAAPERVVAWLLSSPTDGTDNPTARTAAVAMDAATAAQISQALTDFNSYSWLEENACLPEYGVHLRFTKGADTVDILWCCECNHLQVTHNGRSAEKDCAAARFTLIRAIRSVFPNDASISNLSLLNPNQSK
jgi:hypothetical protein